METVTRAEPDELDLLRLTLEEHCHILTEGLMLEGSANGTVRASSVAALVTSYSLSLRVLVVGLINEPQAGYSRLNTPGV